MKDAWWSEEYDFFGEFYIEGDDSLDGYLINTKQSLVERTETEVDGIEKLLGTIPGKKVLDLPCGYGRHSIELAQRGYEVVGMDINLAHLEVARHKAVNSTNPEFIKKGMQELDEKEEFDAIINMFYSFGFFETDEENMDVLQRFYDSLKPGGKLLMHTDVNIPTIRSGQYKEHEFRTLTSGNKLEIIDRYNPDTKRIDGSWIIHKKDGTEERKDYSVRVYEKDEFVAMCKEVGFVACEVYGDWDRSMYTGDSEDMMVVAIK